MEDHRTVDCYSLIEKKLTILLVVVLEERPQLFIESQWLKYFPLDFKPSDTVEELKEKIAENDFGYPPVKNQDLSIIRGTHLREHLRDGKTLSEYNIQNASTVYVGRACL